MNNREERIKMAVLAYSMEHGFMNSKLIPITEFQDVDADIRFDVFIAYNKMCQEQNKNQQKK